MKKILLCILTGFSFLIVKSQDTIFISDRRIYISSYDSSSVAIIPHYIDSSGNLTLNDVLKKQFTKEVKPENSNSYNNKKNSWWFKITFKNSSKKSRNFLISPPDEIYEKQFILILYDTTLSGNQEVKNGSVLPDSIRDVINSASLALRFYLDIGHIKTFFLNVRPYKFNDKEWLNGKARVDFAVSPNRLDKPSEKNSRVYHGIILGFLLIMAIYHLFLFLLIRIKPYLYFSIYCFSAGLFYFYFNGYGYEVFGNTRLLYDSSTAILLMLAYILFAKNYSENIKQFKKSLIVFDIGIYGALLFLAIFILNSIGIRIPTPSVWLVLPIIFVGIFTLFPYIFLARMNDRSSFSFLFANFSFLFFLTLFLFSFLSGMFPSIQSYCFEAGFTFQMLIFAIDLAKKMQTTLLEQNKTQLALLEQLQVNMKLQEKVNRELEVKVKERTVEIEQQKEEIESQRDLVTRQKEHIEGIHKEVTDSIYYAKRIQTAALPDEKLLNEYFSDSFILFKPKDIVSGDFYWFAKVENQIVITVADCTGHGVPGAFMSMLGMSLLKEIVSNEYMTQPDVILKRLRKEIIKALGQTGASGEQKDGMDISLCSINTETLEMQWSGANNPCMIRKDDELIELKADKMPIAIHEKMDKYTLHELKMQKNNVIYLFSDGYHDQFGGPNNRKFMSVRFKELLSSISNKAMSEQKEILDKTIEDWKNSFETKYEQTDDITVMGFKV